MYAHSNSTPSLAEFDTLNNTETIYYYNSNTNSNSNCCSSGYSSYAGSLSPSVSTHYSFHYNHNGTHHPFSAIFADSHNAHLRRVCSTGDLHINGMQHNHHSDSPLSSESSMIIEGMNRACRYSPEEKKVRIERYRSKRNQRNFNKKIKYACRKTLADSRPRIRGRFARNEEIDENNTIHWSQNGAAEEEDEEDENWVTILDSFAATNFSQESKGSSFFGLLY